MVGTHGRASAFVRASEFSAYPDKLVGGGGGRYFTGSPADGFDCSVCHTSPSNYHYPLLQKNLPVGGYVPGKQYREITLSWPEAAAVQAEAKARGLNPQIALMAEFVSEDGGSAGKLEFQLASLRKEGYCAPGPGEALPALTPTVDPTAPMLPLPPYAATIIATTKAKPATEIKAAGPDADNGSCQTGGDDARRCLLWIDPCGATSIKFNWTAPSQLHGPVWFSAGLVVTHHASSKPNDDDYTTLLSVPMNAASDGATYEQSLESGCSVSGAPRAGGASGAGVWLVMMSVLGFVLRTRGRAGARAAVGALALGLAVCSATACSDSSVTSTRASGAIGRFEPVACEGCDQLGPMKCRVGTVDDWKQCRKKSAAGASAAATSGSGGVASLAAATLGPATGGGVTPAATNGINGTLSITFTTAQPPGVVSENLQDCLKNHKEGCPNPNVSAVWISDGSGQYVKNLEFANSLYSGTLTSFVGLGEDCVCEMDIVASATLTDHKPRSLVWNGRTAQGTAAPFGKYNVNIELAIGNKQRYFQSIPVDIPAPPAVGVWPLIIPPGPPHAGVTINFLPNP